MCDPVTIVSAIATAGGAAASMSAQSQVQNARKDVMAAERIRQQGYDQQADALNAHSQGLYQNIGDKQAEAATKLGDFFKGSAAPATVSAAAAAPGAQEQTLMPASSNSIVTANDAKQMGVAKAYTDQQGAALGNYKAFGDIMGSLGRDQARDAGYIGQIGGFKRRSSNVIPLELEQANTAGDGTAALGTILTGLGKVGMMAGLSGGAGDTGNGSYANPFLESSAHPLSGVQTSLPTFAAGKTGGFTAPFNIGQAGLSLPTFARGKNPFTMSF